MFWRTSSIDPAAPRAILVYTRLAGYRHQNLRIRFLCLPTFLQAFPSIHQSRPPVSCHQRQPEAPCPSAHAQPAEGPHRNKRTSAEDCTCLWRHEDDYLWDSTSTGARSSSGDIARSRDRNGRSATGWPIWFRALRVEHWVRFFSVVYCGLCQHTMCWLGADLRALIGKLSANIRQDVAVFSGDLIVHPPPWV